MRDTQEKVHCYLTLPLTIKTVIKLHANRNSRSVNAEITERLINSLNKGVDATKVKKRR